MKWFRLFILAAAASITAAGTPAADGPSEAGAAVTVAKLPPVLRPLEPADNRLLTLPGPKPVARAVKRVPPMAPVAKASPISNLILEDYALRQPIPVPAIRPPAPKPAPPAAAPVTMPAVATAKPSPMPPAPNATAPIAPAPVAAKVAAAAASVRELAALCQKQIGRWKERDARELLGAPLRQRSAYDEKKNVNGTIYAYADPSNQYKELELDFDRKTGTLRTVFAYPPGMTWQECRRHWTGPITAADAAQGRKFYSFTTRRLDVLVDPAGKVISLGWY